MANIGGAFKFLFLIAQMINFSYSKLIIKKNFMRNVFSNYISSRDPAAMLPKIGVDNEKIPQENEKFSIRNEQRFQKEYKTSFSNLKKKINLKYEQLY